MAMDFGFNGMMGLSIELMNHGDEPQNRIQETSRIRKQEELEKHPIRAKKRKGRGG